MTSPPLTALILASVCELIAERLDDSNEDPALFLEQYTLAISQANDLETVWPKLALWVLMDSEFGIVQYVTEHPAEYTGIALVVSLYERLLNHNQVGLQEWSDAFQACRFNLEEVSHQSNCMIPVVLTAVSAAAGVMLPMSEEIKECFGESLSLAEDVLFGQAQCLALTNLSLAKVALAQKDKFLDLIADRGD